MRRADAASARAAGRDYAPIGRAGRRELARYSAEELTVILGFLQRGIRPQPAQAERIRAWAPSLLVLAPLGRLAPSGPGEFGHRA